LWLCVRIKKPRTHTETRRHEEGLNWAHDKTKKKTLCGFVSDQKMNENEIGRIVVDCAIRLHMELGPGLLENVYEVLLAHQIQETGLHVERQVPIPI
jgi:hypothetical protein